MKTKAREDLNNLVSEAWVLERPCGTASGEEGRAQLLDAGAHGVGQIFGLNA